MLTFKSRHSLDQVRQIHKLLAFKFLSYCWRHPLKGQIIQLAIRQNQWVTVAPHLSKSLDEFRAWLIVLLPHGCQIWNLLFPIWLYKYAWNFCSRSAHPVIKFGSSDENQLKVDLDKDRGKNRTLCAFSTDASPSWMRYRFMCSKVVISSTPVNLEKSGTL
jgi:hypothetical protein